MNSEPHRARTQLRAQESGAAGIEDFPTLGPDISDCEPSAETVIEALRAILESECFRSSKRGKQFLDFVVRYRLRNSPESLKERTIGVALFNRSIDYATGEDSVVRAQAREVRRRLEQYYLSCPQDSRVRIDLPVGSYSPLFRWVRSPSENDGVVGDSSLPVTIPPLVTIPASESSPKKAFSKRRYGLFALAAVCVLLLVTGGIFIGIRKTSRKSTISEFWAPVLASTKPLLICLPKPILYRPSAALYKRTAQFPGEFDSEAVRMSQAPHLRPEDLVRWNDMVVYYDFGVGEGDVQAAFKLSSFLDHKGKESEVRIGDGYSVADLRNSPAIVVGAFSNKLALDLTSHLHFAFTDDAKGLRIQEQGPAGRSWASIHGIVGEDYGLVTRLINSTTGQFVVFVAGVEGSGSDAAADLISRPEALDSALRNEPADWHEKNVQIVVSTTVRDFVAGPPKVVAVYVW